MYVHNMYFSFSFIFNCYSSVLFINSLFKVMFLKYFDRVRPLLMSAKYYKLRCIFCFKKSMNSIGSVLLSTCEFVERHDFNEHDQVIITS